MATRPERRNPTPAVLVAAGLLLAGGCSGRPATSVLNSAARNPSKTAAAGATPAPPGPRTGTATNPPGTGPSTSSDRSPGAGTPPASSPPGPAADDVRAPVSPRRAAAPAPSHPPTRPSPIPPAPAPDAGPRPALAPGAVVLTGAPDDPVALDHLADDIATDEAALASPSTSAHDIGFFARRQQIAYRQLSRSPSALPRVLGRVPAGLRGVVAANVRAGAELLALTHPKDQLPPWRIVAPPAAPTLLACYHAAERATGIPWTYLAAVHLVETRMGRIRGTSSAGAQGPMQFLPSTWARYGAGGDINDPRDAIAAAARYLRAAGGPADMRRALRAYNHSDHYVEAVSLYAERMAEDPRAYLAYHEWQVYYLTPAGDVLLPVGYGAG